MCVDLQKSSKRQQLEHQRHRNAGLTLLACAWIFLTGQGNVGAIKGRGIFLAGGHVCTSMYEGLKVKKISAWSSCINHGSRQHVGHAHFFGIREAACCEVQP